MEPEEKSLAVRIIGLATGITAVTTAVVLSSVAGMSAYLAYQPSALEAQAIQAAPEKQLVGFQVPITLTPISTTTPQATSSAPLPDLLYSGQ